jgi:hypothetical protein
MERKFFDSCEDLCEYMIDQAQNGTYSVAVLFYDDAMWLIREFAKYDDIDIEALNIEPYDYNFYGKEYYVSLANDMVLSVEPAYVDGRYLSTEADIMLVDGDACSTILKYLPERKCREIYIGEDEYSYDNYDSNDDDLYTVNLDSVKAKIFNEDDDDYKKLSHLFENAEVIRDKNGKLTDLKFDCKLLLDYIFG